MLLNSLCVTAPKYPISRNQKIAKLMNNSNKLLFAYKELLIRGKFAAEYFDNLADTIGDLLFSIESCEDKDAETLGQLQNLLNFYAEKSDLILNNCRADLTDKLLDLFSRLEFHLNGIYTKKIAGIIPFQEKMNVSSSGVKLSESNLRLVTNKTEEDIVSETVANVISLLGEGRHDIMQPLLEKFKFGMWIKDEFNNILYINTPAALVMKGTVQDFQNRNAYDISPSMGKKYHEDDLKVIGQNKPVKNIESQFRLRNKSPFSYAIIDKIPVRTVKNKPLVLGTLRSVSCAF